ncbi:MAG: sulfur transferase domain-containing protein [Cyanobacteria bacterium J06638_22]
METIRKINDELAIAGQIGLEQLFDLADEGFRSVLNLRSPQERGFLWDEEHKATLLALTYLNLPMTLDDTNDERLLSLFKQIGELPKPILIHCDTGIRSALIVLMYLAIQNGATPRQAFQQAQTLGLLAPIPQR